MAKRHFGTYCRIIDYLDAVDPELATIMRGTCTDMSLNLTKTKRAVTLVIPQDKAYRSKLSELAFSNNVEDANLAADMLNAHIMRQAIRNPSEWRSQEVSNCLHPPQKVEVESTGANEVVLKSKARLVLDETFQKASRRDNLAVWKLVSGEIPVTSDNPAKEAYGRPKTGAYDAGILNSRSERFKIALAVENAYALNRLQHESPGGIGHEERDVYLEHTLSLVNYIMNVRKDNALLYEKVLPLISLDKLDFYLLVEPHNSSGNYLLDDTLIHEWWVKKNSVKCVLSDVVKGIESMLNSGSTALVYTDRAKLLDKIADKRQEYNRIVGSRPRLAVDEIAKYYDELESANTIGGVGPVYPAALAQYYAANKGLKMIQDELRYLTYGAFTRLEQNAFDYGAFHELVLMIGECLYAGSAEERARQHKLLNKNLIKYLITPTETIEEVTIYVYSTFFLYIVMTKSEASGLKVKHSVRRPDPSNIVVFNIAKDLYTRHQRLLSYSDKSPANIDLVQAILSLDPASLDPELRAKLEQKFSSAP